ncbi:hypothetical protein KBT16_02305 [Nostoc sp. CCCryo 231-06]|nr:hypothetical protein [Nostoc sp. CCCryo 231-06]
MSPIALGNQKFSDERSLFAEDKKKITASGKLTKLSVISVILRLLKCQLKVNN